MSSVRRAGARAVRAALALGLIAVLPGCLPSAASAQALPLPAARIPDANDQFLDQFAQSLDALGAAGAADFMPRLEQTMALLRRGPEPEGPAARFDRAQRLRMDALVGRMADLQGRLAAIQAERSAGTKNALAALADGAPSRGRYDQTLERFARELDAYAAAIAAGDRAGFAAIGLLLQADARAIIPIGTNGSVAQRNRAMILSGRYAKLAEQAAKAASPKPGTAKSAPAKTASPKAKSAKPATASPRPSASPPPKKS